MLTFIVHLEHEREKRERLEEQLQREKVSYEFVHAVDGQQDLSKYTFSILPQWTDPFSRKTLTKGEIGCALSHALLWQRIVDEHLPGALILEDDVVLGEDFLATLTDRMKGAPEYDLMYLGRRPLRSSLEVEEPFIVAKYSYGTHAYLLSYEGAQKLVAGNYLQHIIPVDEYLPLLYDPEYPHTEYLSYFTPIPLRVYSVHPLLIHPVKGELYKSTTYHTEPYLSAVYDDYLVLSVGTSPNDARSRFEQSCRTYGHPYKMLGDGMEWKGGCMAEGPGGGQKINLLYDELMSWSSEELERLVLFTDSYDVIFVSHPKEVYQKYKALTGDMDLVVFSSEPTCWPEPCLASLYTCPPYLNSGGFIGKGKQILSFLQQVPPDSDDQLYYTHQFLNRNDILLDRDSILFQTLNESPVEWLKNGRVQNQHGLPCILHGNGPSSTKRYLNRLENYLLGWSDVYKYCITAHSTETPLVYVNASYLPTLSYPSDQLIWKSFSLNEVVHDFLSTSADYLLMIEPTYHITNPDTLMKLLHMKKTIVGPMVKKGNTAWCNFWGDVSETGYYKRSDDYMDMVHCTKRSVWNVPYLTGIYLVKRCFLERFPHVYTCGTMDADMAFAKQVREAHYFMYVSNLETYGYIEDGPPLTQLSSPTWEQEYLHPDYLRYRGTSELCQEPCSDVYRFPLFSAKFCKELIELCESSGAWSEGRSDVMDPRIGTYENVPTRDIHLHQLSIDSAWEKIIHAYIAPVANTMYHSYKTKKTNISFVVKYSMDGQKELKPHHDSSTYTISICLNDAFEGGGCYFIRQKCFVQHHQIGYATMHPGRLTHYHEGRPITSGTRYILVCFVD